MLLFMGSCNWESADLETLLGQLLCRHWKNQQVSDWTKVSVMIRTSVTLQQEKATHCESPSFLFIDLKRFLLLFIVYLFQNRQQAG